MDYFWLNNLIFVFYKQLPKGHGGHNDPDDQKCANSNTNTG